MKNLRCSTQAIKLSAEIGTFQAGSIYAVKLELFVYVRELSQGQSRLAVLTSGSRTTSVSP